MKLSPHTANQLLELASQGIQLLSRAAVLLIKDQERSEPQVNKPSGYPASWGSGRHPGEAPNPNGSPGLD